MNQFWTILNIAREFFKIKVEADIEVDIILRSRFEISKTGPELKFEIIISSFRLNFTRQIWFWNQFWTTLGVKWKTIKNQYDHQAEAKVEAGFQGRFFKKVIQNSNLNFEIMFLGQFCTLNSILESILIDSGHKMKNYEKLIFWSKFCLKISKIPGHRARSRSSN